jgi:PPOX class probable F420-dependent enzyme
VWIEVDGEEIVFTTWHESLKARALKRDPRISLCVQDDQPPFSFVTIQGTARFIESMDELKKWAGRIGGRYMGAEHAAAYGERNGVPGEHLVRVHVSRIIGDRDVAA